MLFGGILEVFEVFKLIFRGCLFWLVILNVLLNGLLRLNLLKLNLYILFLDVWKILKDFWCRIMWLLNGELINWVVKNILLRVWVFLFFLWKYFSILCFVLKKMFLMLLWFFDIFLNERMFYLCYFMLVVNIFL